MNIITNDNFREHSDEIPPGFSDEIENTNRRLQLNQKKVLVVEDSADSRELLSMLLKKAGAMVETANDGKQGLEKVKSYNPDLLLLDLEMPEMDGFAVIKQLKSQEYKKPIIAISAHNTAHDKDRCHEAGFDGYISKPFNPDRLLEILKAHMSSV